MEETKSLSERGRSFVEASIRPDVPVIIEAFANEYHPDDHPEGCLMLNIAENKLGAPVIREYIQDLFRKTEIPEWVSYYTYPQGHPDFLSAFSQFYERYVSGVRLDPSHIVCSSGLTAVIELSAMILGDEWDLVAFPAPAYPAYTGDIGLKAKLERLNFELHDFSSGERKPITRALLDEVLNKSCSQAKKMRLLVLTSPDNPTGTVYSADELKTAAEWCMEKKVHLIVNEVYALSRIEDVSYFSFAQIMDHHKNPYLHLWYGLSKDFSSSGYRVGFLYSFNRALLSAYNNINGPQMVSGITQWIFTCLLSDHPFVDRYIRNNRNELKGVCNQVMQVLREKRIPYLSSASPFFLWVNFSAYLKHFPNEYELWMAIYKEAGILLTPGEGFGHSQEGWFRLVYSCLTVPALETFSDRLNGLIDRWDTTFDRMDGS